MKEEWLEFRQEPRNYFLYFLRYAITCKVHEIDYSYLSEEMKQDEEIIEHCKKTAFFGEVTIGNSHFLNADDKNGFYPTLEEAKSACISCVRDLVFAISVQLGDAEYEEGKERVLSKL